MKTVWQMDAQGYCVGPVQADPSPLEPGAYLIPAGCVETPPPAGVLLAQGQAFKWVRGAWQVVTVPVIGGYGTPVEKLRAFLAANPDVMAMING